MNILYLCDEYPPGRHGGIGTYVRLIARQMVKLGHTVIVAGLYSRGYGGEDEFDDEGVKIYRYRWATDGRWFENKQSLPVRMASRFLLHSGITRWDIRRSLVGYQTKLDQIISAAQIDIVEMPDYNDYIRFCRHYVPFPRLSVPVVVKMNGSITYFTAEANKKVAPLVLKAEQAILNQAAAVSSASRYTAAKSAVYLSYPKPVEVLYNGIDTCIKQHTTKANPLQVIFTGSLVQKKGIYQLAKAWNLVHAKIPGARLLVLGKGQTEQVIACLNKQAITSVTFAGHVGTAALYKHLSASRVAVFPSYAEAFALAPLEAMACGIAVINSNRTSGTELIDDGLNGLLINPDDIKALAAAIIYLLSDDEACLKLATNGKQKVKACFDIAIIARQTLAFYERVLRGSKA